MRQIPTGSRHGCLPRTLLSLHHPQEESLRTKVIIQVHDVVKRMSQNKHLWVVRDMMPIQEAIGYLIEESFSPKENMLLMDEVSKYIDKDRDLRELFDEGDLTVLELELESYQREIDERIAAGLSSIDGSFRYVVTDWLGDSSLVVLVTPFTSEQHEASKNYPYSTAIEPYRFSDILGLL